MAHRFIIGGLLFGRDDDNEVYVSTHNGHRVHSRSVTDVLLFHILHELRKQNEPAQEVTNGRE